MKFFENGPDIPDELIAAQEKGQVIFVCGAGVSRMAGLPLFRELVEDVYRRLGEDWSLHTAEREGMEEDGRLARQYDRVLRCLEKRLAASNVSRSRGMYERIRTAVRESLTLTNTVALKNHAALLQLSRDADGGTRLLTTNFDTLFERAWLEAHGSAILSHAGPAMPQPKTTGCTGVLHLHGRIFDNVLSLSDTDLVLTSAEFGDAYLRSGWASRYVYDLVRAYSVVFVGYQADDPPMRYLLEVLEADRERYSDLQRVYAFASCAVGEDEVEAALWRAKAVEPILYTTQEDDHAPLYDTILEWQRYAEDPTDWRRARLTPLLSNAPKTLIAADIERCVSYLMHGDAAQLLGELSPSAEWLPILRENHVFENNTTSPGSWIGARIDDPQMIRVCAGFSAFDEQTTWFIDHAIEQRKETLSHIRQTAWQLMLASKRRTNDHHLEERWFSVSRRIKKGDAGFTSRQLVAKLLRPRLVIEKAFRWGDGDIASQEPESLSSLLHLGFAVARHPPAEEILKVWPRNLEQEVRLFLVLNRYLLDALEEAEDLGYLENWDHSDHDVPSVATHKQNSYRDGFYPIVRVLADLWTRIAEEEPTRVRQHIIEWSQSRFKLFKRLSLFAMANSYFTSREVIDAIMSLDDRTFWLSGAQVEIMRVLLARWGEFEDTDRHNIESRLRAGVPRNLFDEDAFTDDEKWNSVSDSTIYRRLTRFKSGGLVLTDESQRLLTEIAGRHPQWQPNPGDRDDFHSWHESRWGLDGHPELLKNVADEDLVQEALRIQRERRFNEADVWRLFCSSDPERAVAGLSLNAEHDRWEPEAWQSFIWSLSEKGNAGLQSKMAALLLKMPEAALRPLLGSTTSWLRKQRDTLINQDVTNNAVVFALWDRFAELVYAGQEENSSADDNDDLIFRSLNEPGGILVGTLLDCLVAAKPQPDNELSEDFAPRFTRAINAVGRQGLLARVYIASELAYFDQIAPIWTSENLIPMFSWNNTEAILMWRSYSNGHIGSARLFNSLKPGLLQSFERRDFLDSEFEGLTAFLLSVCIWHQRGNSADYLLSSAEMRRVLTVGAPAVRKNVSWNFWIIMSSDTEEPLDKGERWRRLIGPIFRDIWPLDHNLRTGLVSNNLTNMALECASAFPDAVNAILDVIVPYRLYRIVDSLRLEAKHENLHREHPLAFLKLANALIDPSAHPVPSDLAALLQECVESNPDIVNEPEYRRLYGLRRFVSA